MTSGHQILTSAAIPPPSSRASGHRSRSALVRAASWPAWSSLFGSDSTCGQPPLTVSTTVVPANAIVYDSQLDLMPAVRRRGPPPTSTHRPYGEGHHRTRGLGPLWREGAPGAARPQDRHHLQRPTPWPSRRWPPGSPEASGDEWLHRASNRWPRFVVVYGRWPGPTLPRLSATARSAGMRLRSTLVIRRTCRAPDAN